MEYTPLLVLAGSALAIAALAAAAVGARRASRRRRARFIEENRLPHLPAVDRDLGVPGAPDEAALEGLEARRRLLAAQAADGGVSLTAMAGLGDSGSGDGGSCG